MEAAEGIEAARGDPRTSRKALRYSRSPTEGSGLSWMGFAVVIGSTAVLWGRTRHDLEKGAAVCDRGW